MGIDQIWTSFFRRKEPLVPSVKRRFMGMIGISLLGIAFGAFFVSRQSVQEGLEVSFQLEHYAPREKGEWLSCVGESFAAVLPYFGMLLLCGMTMFGGAAVPFVLFFHGLGLGTILGCLYRYFGWNGVGYSLGMVLPHGFFTIVLFVLVGIESLRFSRRLTLQTLEWKPPEGSSRLAWKKYLLRCGIYGAGLLLVSILDATAVVLCGDWFRLGV